MALSKNVLTSIHKNYYVSVGDIIINNQDATKYVKGLVVYTNCHSLGAQKTQVWPPIYDITLNSLQIINKTNVNENDAHNYFGTLIAYYCTGNQGITSEHFSSSLNYYDDWHPQGDGPIFCYGPEDYGYCVAEYTLPTFSASLYKYIRYGFYIHAGYFHSDNVEGTSDRRLIYYDMYDPNGKSVNITDEYGSDLIARLRSIYINDYNEDFITYKPRLAAYVGHKGISLLYAYIHIQPVRCSHNATFTTTVDSSRYKFKKFTNSYDLVRNNALILSYHKKQWSSGTLADRCAIRYYTAFNTLPSITYKAYNNSVNDTLYCKSENSYVLFLNSVLTYDGTFRVPNNHYVCYSTTATLTPKKFGYYFYGEFSVNNSYIWGTEGNNRNYTGKGLLDFDTTTYISHYRFSPTITGLSKWTTSRQPSLWTASLSESELNYTFSTDWRINSNYTRICGVFISDTFKGTLYYRHFGHIPSGHASGTVYSQTASQPGSNGSSTYAQRAGWSIDGTNGDTPFNHDPIATYDILKESNCYVSGNTIYIRLTAETLTKVLDASASFRPFNGFSLQLYDSAVFLGIGDTRNGIAYKWANSSDGNALEGSHTDNFGVTTTYDEKPKAKTIMYTTEDRTSIKPSSFDIYIYICQSNGAGFNKTMNIGVKIIRKTVYYVPSEWAYTVTHYNSSVGIL